MALTLYRCAAAGTVPRPQERPTLPSRLARQRKLTLSRVPKDRDGDWSADDYDVFDGNQHVGRIILTTQAPQGMPWSWTITARPDSAQNRGFSVSLEQAMRELTARWVNPSRV